MVPAGVEVDPAGVEMGASGVEMVASGVEMVAAGVEMVPAGVEVVPAGNLTALAIAGMKQRKQLQAIVRNKFKGNAAVLAEWESAQHIERASKSAKPPTTPA